METVVPEDTEKPPMNDREKWAVLSKLRARVQHDKILSDFWEQTADVKDPTERAGALLDRLNPHYQEVWGSPMEEPMKTNRLKFLSDLATELRTLL